MVTDAPVTYRDMLESAAIKTTVWNEYHSSMKDLTGLWFKAALMEVADKEKLGANAYYMLGQALVFQRGQAWASTLERYVKEMKSRKRTASGASVKATPMSSRG